MRKRARIRVVLATALLIAMLATTTGSAAAKATAKTVYPVTITVSIKPEPCTAETCTEARARVSGRVASPKAACTRHRDVMATVTFQGGSRSDAGIFATTDGTGRWSTTTGSRKPVASIAVRVKAFRLPSGATCQAASARAKNSDGRVSRLSAFSAQADVTGPPLADVTMVSPPSVELPATIVLSSASPDLELTDCFQGTLNPVHPEWGPAPGTATVRCYPYPIAQSGPDASGRFRSEWRLPVSPPGPTAFGVQVPDASGTYVPFTVTGNRLHALGDVRSCTREEVFVYHPGEWYRNHPKWRPSAQGIVDYYGTVDTSLAYQLERFERGRWIVAKRYAKGWDFPIARSEYAEGWDPYSRRETKQNVPKELLFPDKKPAPRYRVAYLIRRGTKMIARGVVAKTPCRKVSDPPYWMP